MNVKRVIFGKNCQSRNVSSKEFYTGTSREKEEKKKKKGVQLSPWRRFILNIGICTVYRIYNDETKMELAYIEKKFQYVL